MYIAANNFDFRKKTNQTLDSGEKNVLYFDCKQELEPKDFIRRRKNGMILTKTISISGGKIPSVTAEKSSDMENFYSLSRAECAGGEFFYADGRK